MTSKSQFILAGIFTTRTAHSLTYQTHRVLAEKFPGRGQRKKQSRKIAPLST